MSDFGIVKSSKARPLKTSASDFHVGNKGPKFPSSPYVSSFKLFKCPTRGCKKTLSPSTTLAHFIADHRNLTPHNLHPGGIVTMDVGPEFQDFADFEPNAIRFVQVHVGTSVVPLLINVCCLSENDQQRHSKFDHPARWVCVWLSSICNFDNWFSISLNKKGSPATSMTKICKPVLSQHPMSTQEILADFNVMIVEYGLIEEIRRRETRLKLDVTMHEK